jgi:hypothetical protein
MVGLLRTEQDSENVWKQVAGVVHWVSWPSVSTIGSTLAMQVQAAQLQARNLVSILQSVCLQHEVTVRGPSSRGWG